jgi:hypothetical protein
MSKPIYIYALVDPENGDIRYIGKSIRPEKRLQNHMNEVSNCHRSHWLQSLKKQGAKPDLLILEEIRGDWPWQHSERYWIARGRREGWLLTNNTSGGDGVPDLPPETRAKLRAAWTGRKHSPESKAKMSASLTGRVHSDATKKSMSDAHSGREILWVDRVSDGLRKLTNEQMQEITKARSLGSKIQDLAIQYGVHRTTISKVKTGTYAPASGTVIQTSKAKNG